MKTKQLFALVLSSAVLAGCGIGNAPSGPSEDQINSMKASLPIDKQIQLIQNSPMPKAQKEAAIAKLKAQAQSGSKS